LLKAILYLPFAAASWGFFPPHPMNKPTVRRAAKTQNNFLYILFLLKNFIDNVLKTLIDRGKQREVSESELKENNNFSFLRPFGPRRQGKLLYTLGGLSALNNGGGGGLH
jgi:hypothetical protein